MNPNLQPSAPCAGGRRPPHGHSGGTVVQRSLNAGGVYGRGTVVQRSLGDESRVRDIVTQETGSGQ